MNMLDKKIKSNRIKPKYSGKNKKVISKEDKGHLEWLQTTDYGCLVCGNLSNREWHHVKEHSTDKKNHKRLIPLCCMHHRLSNEFSAHGTPSLFRKTYPMEVQNALADKIYQIYAHLSI